MQEIKGSAALAKHFKWKRGTLVKRILAAGIKPLKTVAEGGHAVNYWGPAQLEAIKALLEGEPIQQRGRKKGSRNKPRVKKGARLSSRRASTNGK